ncbi:MAG: AAA family ATPase, partial [Anaerolineales bacterium]
MSPALNEQINKLKSTIGELEAQRAVLGNEFVDSTLSTLQEKLVDLEAQADQLTLETPAAPKRQRKLVTLLYLDVVGSTAMTQHLDPEDTLEIMDNALPRLAIPIERHAGHVTRYTGDGFKAVFGDPLAREDDPEQAIRAGLEILDLSRVIALELEQEWDIGNFQVRIGIDTGLAALGGQTEAEDTVMGRVVNLAVRIESAAPPGGLLISHNTFRHVRGVFNVEPQEPITAKGFPEPVQVYLVKEIKPRAFRVQTRGVEGVETRMVGRNDELRFLQDALMTAFEEGEGHVVTISGEAGVGKSRLLYEFQNWLELQPPTKAVRLFLGRGEQESQGNPYNLLRDLFVFRFQILDHDSGEQARQKIENGFTAVLGDDENAVMKAHIIGQLLGFDFSASPHLKGVLNDPEQLRNRGVMYLIQYFQALSREIPVVIFLEDIHWADDSSLDIINQLGERAAELPILIVCAARLRLFERRPYWGEGQDFHTLLELHSLSKRESRNLVTEILKLAVDIPAELRELVVRGAEGNPFYTEELIKMLIEAGVIIPGEVTWHIDLTLLDDVDVPSTLAGVLQARLDSLPIQERTVLQQASVVGRLFWDRIVAYIQAEGGNGGDPQLIPQTLTSLRDRELVYRHEESVFAGSVEYLFKHDILREVAYESVIKRLRKTYHGLVADWLIKNSSDRIGEFYGLIAEHFLLAGREEEACQYFYLAGDSALASYANSEAENYYRQASDLSPSDHLRADLLTGLGESLHRQGITREASSFWQEAINLYELSGNYDRMANVYARLSILLWESEDYLKPWQVCQEGLIKMEGKPDSPGYANLLAEAGRTALFRNISDQVIPLCQRALQMAERVGDLDVAANAKLTLAFRERDIREQTKIYEEVIAETEANNLLRTAARAHNNLGVLLSNWIDNHSALQHYYRAAEIWQQICDIAPMMDVALSNVIFTSIWLGNLDVYEDKITGFLAQTPISETHREKELVLYETYKKISSLAKGKWIEALDMLRARVKDRREKGYFHPLANNNVWLADTILELNRFGYLDEVSEAEKAMKENIEINWNILASQFTLVTIFTRQGKYSEASSLLKNTEEDFNDLRTNEYKVELSRARCELAQAEGRWNEAIDACETFIEICQNCGQYWELARKLIDLGDIYVSRNNPGDLERARQTYQQSLDMFTEM